MKMYAVKSLKPQTILEYTSVSGDIVKGAGKRTQNHITYAVVDENGNVTKDNKGEYDIFSRKSTAETVADSYNSNLRI